MTPDLRTLLLGTLIWLETLVCGGPALGQIRLGASAGVLAAASDLDVSGGPFGLGNGPSYAVDVG